MRALTNQEYAILSKLAKRVGQYADWYAPETSYARINIDDQDRYVAHYKRDAWDRITNSSHLTIVGLGGTYDTIELTVEDGEVSVNAKANADILPKTKAGWEEFITKLEQSIDFFVKDQLDHSVDPIIYETLDAIHKTGLEDGIVTIESPDGTPLRVEKIDYGNYLRLHVADGVTIEPRAENWGHVYVVSGDQQVRAMEAIDAIEVAKTALIAVGQQLKTTRPSQQPLEDVDDPELHDALVDINRMLDERYKL